MSALGLIIALALPVALVLSGFVYYGRHQQKQQAQRLQAALIRSKADELKEALELLVIIDGHRELQMVVLERLQHLYRLSEDALPYESRNDQQEAEAAAGESSAGTTVESLRAKIEANGEVRPVLKSDREIRFAKQQFNRILKSLGAMARQKVISETTLAEYRRYLRLTLLEREVDTFVAQGDLAAERGDVVSAGGYYKAAKKLLIECDIQYPEKNERIRDLSHRSATLYSGGVVKEDKLSRALSKEAEPNMDAHGIPLDPNEKRKY
ncbi:hypothetical protein [Parathalassolituus penaei]|uniref:Uncharacterized protein n=1 Tax=Parathalassolituus penaei TaxID=2997323 RepID=A0A9X3EF21_9GAMM|nr:hypothetical protein [Parathalassolituus penaei]MCY0966392.1 hypothetical protein [Parathalassolituus penaei]